MKISQRIIQIANDFLYLFFPKRCCGCGKVIFSYDDFCDECDIEKYRVSYPKCFLCGQKSDLCSCSEEKRIYDLIDSPFYYEKEAGKCIRNFKFRGYFDNGKYLAREMVKTLKRDFPENDFDIAASVALTKKRKRHRGFSQTDYMMQIIARELNLNYDPKLLIKVKDTLPQTQLTAKERKTNLVGAFRVRKDADIKGMSVLLCDDIKTTGSTLNECAKVLKQAGAARVVCITAAVTKNNFTGENN